MSDTLKATSVRLSNGCLQEMSVVSNATGISRSEIIRRGVALVHLAHTVSDKQKLALVDTGDSMGAAHYRVTEWVDAPTI
jgi:hypothetical protein